MTSVQVPIFMSTDEQPDNLVEVIEASRQEPPYVRKSNTCKNPDCPNGGVISIPAYEDQDYCCIDCKKALGKDVSSTGTMMFVTYEEKRAIDASRRAGKNIVVRRA